MVFCNLERRERQDKLAMGHSLFLLAIAAAVCMLEGYYFHK